MRKGVLFTQGILSTQTPLRTQWISVRGAQIIDFNDNAGTSGTERRIVIIWVR